MTDELHLPAEIPAMTLPGVVFFPKAMMPLHIFEPRYRRMLADVLGSHRMFALLGLDEKAVADGADLGAMSRNYPAMSWKELGTLAREGWAMAAHTRTHPMLAQLFNEPGGAGKCAIEITDVRQEIEAHLGETPDWFTYPGPSWNEELEEIVKQTYHTARWWSLPGDPPHYVTRESNPYRLPANDICAHRSFDDFCRIIDGMF